MSRHRHRKRGGHVKETAYDAQDSNVLKEAEERKRGGHIQHGEGKEPKRRADRKTRARGGGVGADRRPLTTAAKVHHITKGEEAEEGGPSD